MELKPRTLEDNRMEFAVLAIEASAKKMGISPAEMHQRLKKQQLIGKRLFQFYDLLHTQSIAWITDDIIETLTNWEANSAQAIDKKGGTL